MSSLREAAQQALDLLLDTQIPATPDVDAAIIALRAALAGQMQEPVAWINWSALTGKPRLDFSCESEIASEPLYTAPPKRKPLTDRQILDLLPDAQHGWTTAFYGRWVARAVERAHGISHE